MTSTTETTLPTSAEANVTRQFKAPVALVFKAWSTAELWSQWFGPTGFTMTVHTMEFQAGGTFSFTFHGPDGQDFPAFGRYVEIVPDERIVWTSGFPNGPSDDQVHTTVQFAARDGGTEVKVRQVMSPLTPETAPAAAGMQLGWEQTIDNLGTFLAQ